MPSNPSFVQKGRGRLTTAMLILSIGLAMMTAGLQLGGPAGRAPVAIAAKPAETGAPDGAPVAAIPRQYPMGEGLWRSGVRKSREVRGAAPRFKEPGDLRLYLLRSAATAHRLRWLGEATTPEFS